MLHVLNRPAQPPKRVAMLHMLSGTPVTVALHGVHQLSGAPGCCVAHTALSAE